MPALAEVVRLRTSACRDAATSLQGLAGGEELVDPAVRAHVERCLRCQAEVVAYRRILRGLRSLRHEVVTPPPGALAAVLAALEAADARHTTLAATWAARAAYVGGITVATGAAGVLVWLGRRRLGLATAS